MTTIEFGEALAKVNAGLNTTSTVLLLCGYIAVKRRMLDTHKWAMIGAVVTSSVFLIGYLTRFYLTGSHRFPDVGLWRTIYLVILISHMILAVVTVPLVLRSLYLAYRKRFIEHRKLARVTFPIWMYVSVTGVVVYAMLYHLAPSLLASRA
jgi:putative membrane protein